jgi:WD40 repeat protein
MLVMKPSVGLSLLCLVICGCGSTGSPQRTSRKILVIGGADYDEPAGPVGVVRADGTSFHWLTRWSAVEARWSPDGRRIAVIVGDNVSGDVSIVVMNADGHGQRQVVPVWGLQPPARVVSKRRAHLFARRSALWSTRADGSDKRRLARGVGDAGWSPDGRRIVFICGPDICLVDADGGKAKLARKAPNGVFFSLAAWHP